MPKRLRLTRRLPVALSEDAYRKLRGLCVSAGLDEGEALSFLLENLDGVVDHERFAHRLRVFNGELEARKR
jgi:hypothetical protein